MKAMLRPDQHLAGATPESLARALLRPKGSTAPRRRVEPVVRDKVSEQQAVTEQSSDGITHLK